MKDARRRHRLAAVSLLLVVLTLGALSPAAAPASPELVTDTLELRAELTLVSNLGGCPAPPGASDCAARIAWGPVPGLGAVTERYQFLLGLGPPWCAPGTGRALASSTRFVVAEKGEIHFALAAADCIPDQGPIYNQLQAYTITGGTGLYAGASGSGTVVRSLGEPTDSGRTGRETWVGTIVVPGLEFDTTRPVISRATNRTVKAVKGAKRARVVFRVTARDDRDGAVATACSPRSGTRFSLGRTRVRCEAVDSSGNSATASFVITVKPTR